MRIYTFHLLNDLSGSPKVLSQILKGLVAKGEKVSLVSSMKQSGFLSDLEGVEYIDNRYAFHQNVILRLIRLFYVQVYIVLKLYRRVKKEDVIYVNTVLPFGAAILGKIKGCKVVYHIHETSMKPKILKTFLFFFVRKMASEVVYVSHFLKEAEPLKVPSTVIYNALESKFLEKAKQFNRTPNQRPLVLMICSLKAYKGVHEFFDLAKNAPSFDFQLVLNAEWTEIQAYFKEEILPDNLTFFSRQSNVSPFYEKADLLLNLSRPDEWVETFGLTVIEAMAYGVPAIVPPVGGIAEIVQEGKTGFKVSCYEKVNLKKLVVTLLKDSKLQAEMRNNCLLHRDSFSEEVQLNLMHKLLTTKG